jgi:hypothetical protein
MELPGGPGSPTPNLYSAVHNKVKESCAMHKSSGIRAKLLGMRQEFLNLLETPAA